MRLDGQLPALVTDNMRNQRRAYKLLARGSARRDARFHRRTIWDDQPEYVEVWAKRRTLSSRLAV
jgi:hypothetical protein